MRSWCARSTTRRSPRASARSRSSSRGRSRRARRSRTTPTRSGPDHRDDRLRRAGGLRPRRGGDHREPRAEARDVEGGRRDRQARGVLRDEHLIACRSIDAGGVDEPSGRFLGLHFFNPAQVMRLLEVIRGVTTTEEAISVGLEFGAAAREAHRSGQGQGRLHRQPAARPVHARRDPWLRGGDRHDRRDRRRR